MLESHEVNEAKSFSPSCGSPLLYEEMIAPTWNTPLWQCYVSGSPPWPRLVWCKHVKKKLHLWSSTSNQIWAWLIQRFQNKMLRTIPWYVKNEFVHSDLKFRAVMEEIRESSRRYQQRLNDHQNHMALNLLENKRNVYRSKRKRILDLISWSQLSVIKPVLSEFFYRK